MQTKHLFNKITKFGLWIKKIFLRSIRSHKWEYRNPACRTCAHCGKNQHYYVTSWGSPIGWEDNITAINYEAGCAERK